MEGKHLNIHAEIVKRCLKGEREAQRELYNLYSKAMYNISYRITNDMDDAEDVLQDAFVSAFRNLHTYKAEASFGVWLKRIVVNKAINFIKKKRLEIVPIEDEERYEDVSSDWSVIEPTISLEKIKAAISLLPDGYRVVFSLYLLEGYDHSEIAQILGISESTSKSQFNRSKKKLRELIYKEVEYER